MKTLLFVFVLFLTDEAPGRKKALDLSLRGNEEDEEGFFIFLIANLALNAVTCQRCRGPLQSSLEAQHVSILLHTLKYLVLPVAYW